MLVPITWLKELVQLPNNISDLTDRLTYAGHMLDKIKSADDDTIIDLELRGNREDLLGLIGIAQEVHALFNTTLNLPPEPQLEQLPTSKTQPQIKVTIQAPELVNRFNHIEITNLKINPSPPWLIHKLKQIDIATINNVVDATNYIMYLTGQPLHAFDTSKITDSHLILRQAKPGETSVTFENTKLKLTDQDLIASDPSKAMGLLGVIGEKTTGVSQTTTTILLEAGNYNQPNVRRSSIRHKLRTDAALRLEKNIDPTLPPYAVKLCAKLICDIADGKIVPNSHQDHSTQKYKNPWKTIRFNTNKIKKLSNLSLPQNEIINILNRLDLQTKVIDKINLEVSIPWRRSDIEGEADLVEEVTRIHGYQHIQSKPFTDPAPSPIEPKYLILESQIRKLLAQLGFKENISNSFINQKQIDIFELNKKTIIPIANPTSPETAFLRPSLLPALISIATKQLEKHQTHIDFFEIGKTYQKSNKKYQELTNISGIKAIKSQKLKSEYQQLLGTLYNFLAYLNIHHPEITAPANQNYLDNQYSTQISYQQKPLIYLGLIPSSLNNKLNLKKHELLIFNLNFDNILTASTSNISVLQFQYPSIIEDLTFTFPPQTYIQPVINQIQKTDPLITEVTLTDTYQNSQTINIHYQSQEKNLTDADVAPIRAQIVKTIQHKFNAKLKGQLLTTENTKLSNNDIKQTSLEDQQYYYQDPYLKKLECQITSFSTKGDQHFVILDKTIFYPEGGGQPSDIGTLNDKKVIHTQTQNGKILHQVRGIFEIGEQVTAKLNWKHRYKYMKAHTAGHLVHDALMTLSTNLTPIKGDHGDNAYLQYQGKLESDIKKNLENKVNQLIQDNLSVVTKSATYEELEKDCQFLPKNLPKNKPLRMIKIGDYPSMPDGGVHVKSTKEIGTVKITSIKSEENTVTISYQIM